MASQCPRTLLSPNPNYFPELLFLLLCFRLLSVSSRWPSGIMVWPGGVSGSGRLRSCSSICLRHSSFLSSRLSRQVKAHVNTSGKNDCPRIEPFEPRWSLCCCQRTTKAKAGSTPTPLLEYAQGFCSSLLVQNMESSQKHPWANDGMKLDKVDAGGEG